MTATLEYQKPVKSGSRLRTAAGILLLVAWTWSVVGLLAIYSPWGVLFLRGAGAPSILSILFTGPILAILGIASLIVSLFARSPWLIIASSGPIAFPIFIFFLINLFGWDPGDAHLPVSILASIYVVAWLVITLLAWNKR